MVHPLEPFPPDSLVEIQVDGEAPQRFLHGQVVVQPPDGGSPGSVLVTETKQRVRLASYPFLSFERTPDDVWHFAGPERDFTVRPGGPEPPEPDELEADDLAWARGDG
jgi:hypothetical protein